MNDNILRKIKNDEYDLETVEKIVTKLYHSELPDDYKLECFLSVNFNDFPKKEVSTAIAYAKSIDERYSLMYFDVQSFMEVFGNNIENKHNYSFPNAAKFFSNGSNNYFKILEVFYHELEHINQYIKYYSRYLSYFSNGKKISKEKSVEFCVIYFDYFINKKVYRFQPLEHRSDSQGTYKTIRFFEKNNLVNFSNIDYFDLFISRLLRDYSIKDGKVISPFEKLLKRQDKKLTKDFKSIKKFIKKNLNCLDYADIFSYGLPIDYELFLEVQNLDMSCFDSVKDVKRYIKRL